jgi:hypothetical protein
MTHPQILYFVTKQRTEMYGAVHKMTLQLEQFEPSPWMVEDYILNTTVNGVVPLVL